MSTIVHKRGAQGRTGQSAPRVIVISTIFLAMLATALLVGRQLFSTPTPAERYQRGLVQLSPDREGRCALFELDNQTGFMRPKGDTPCGDIATVEPSRSSGSNRLNAIADHFKGR